MKGRVLIALLFVVLLPLPIDRAGISRTVSQMSETQPNSSIGQDSGIWCPLSGNLSHAYYETPIVGATVSAAQWPGQTTTGDDGWYLLWLPNGYCYTITASKTGYATAVFTHCCWGYVYISMSSAVAVVTPLSLDASLPPTGSISLTLNIANPGPLQLTYEISESAAPWASEYPISGTVSAGTNHDVEVAITAIPPYNVVSETYTATLNIHSNDPVQTEQPILLSLSVLNCAPGASIDFTWTPAFPLAEEAVTFDSLVTSTISIATYDWDFGDGQHGNEASVPHVYTAAGTYRVSLTIIDACGSTAAHQSTVVVRPIYKNYLSIIVHGFQ